MARRSSARGKSCRSALGGEGSLSVPEVSRACGAGRGGRWRALSRAQGPTLSGRPCSRFKNDEKSQISRAEWVHQGPGPYRRIRFAGFGDAMLPAVKHNDIINK